MCGLCGMAGRGIISEDINWLKQMLYVTALRGEDSTGLSVSKIFAKKEKHSIRKMANDASYFLWKDAVDSKPLLSSNNIHSELFMAHCRDATVGAVNDYNAHPFETNHLIGAHNGTLRSKKFDPPVAKDKKTGRTYPVTTDSKIFFDCMSKHGVVETLKDINDVEDAYAISLYEKGSGKLTLARNYRRPLYIAISERRSVMYWSSEKEMLDFVFARLGMKDDVSIYSLQPDVLYTFDLNRLSVNNREPWETFDLNGGREEKLQREFEAVFNQDVPWTDEDQQWYELGSSTSKKVSVADQYCRACGNYLTLAELGVRTEPKFDTKGNAIYWCDNCSQTEN